MAKTRYSKRRSTTRDRFATIYDIWGDRWRVGERRPTDYRFSVYMGWPDAPDGPQKGGKAGVIVTPALAAHIRANAQRPYHLPLPIGDNARRRIREQVGVGHHVWTETRITWWMDRIDDLSSMTAAAFVAKYAAKAWTRNASLSRALVCRMRLMLIGRQRQPLGWWRQPAVKKILRSSQPVRDIAKHLGVTTWMVYGARQRVRQLGGSARA